MNYKVKELAELSGVSVRTLHWYDRIGLLTPQREENGYRSYSTAQVDRLQEILFYRQMGIPLEEIKMLLSAPDYDRKKTLYGHLNSLRQQQEQLELLIRNVEKTLSALEGECVMSDKEKFEGFKQELIAKNRQKYGAEVIEKYGEEALKDSEKKLSAMSEKQWNNQEELSEEIFRLLAVAMEKQDSSCEEALKAADLHRQWLCFFWKEGMYSAMMHRNMGEMYVADERFTEFYDKRLGKGGAEFLRDAIYNYTKE